MMRFLALVRYLKRCRPAVVYSAGGEAHMLLSWARRVADVETRVVATHHTLESAMLSIRTERVGRHRARLCLCLLRHAFLQMDAIVTASNGGADDLSRIGRIPRERIVAIYNPVVSPKLMTLAKAPLDDPWFRPGAPPVVLAAGRLDDGKDFATLVRAFCRLRRQRPTRLVILGEGEDRGKLEALATALGVAEDMALPGHVSNPFAYMSRARVFVVSSKHEVLPTVLIEALACGLPVVSTDCPAGPSEILAQGEFGALVPVGDDTALSRAINDALERPQPRKRLVERSMRFTAEQAAEKYALFFPRNCGTPPKRPSFSGDPVSFWHNQDLD